MRRLNERIRFRASRTFYLKVAVSLILLILIFFRFQPGDMWDVILAADLSYLWLALLITPVIFFGKAVKWYLLARRVADTVSFREATVSLLAGMGFGLVTPSRLGEVARVRYLSTPDKSRFVGLVAVDRLLDLITVVLLAAIVLAMVLNMHLAAAMIMIPALGALLFLFYPQLSARVIARVARVHNMPFRRQIHQVAEGLSLLSARFLAAIFTLSVLILAVAAYQFYWLLLSFLVPDSLEAAFVAFPILTLAGVLPITIGGFGTREGASVLALSLYDIPGSVAINAALLSFLLNTLLPAVIGLFVAPTIPTGDSDTNVEKGIRAVSKS